MAEGWFCPSAASSPRRRRPRRGHRGDAEGAGSTCGGRFARMNVTTDVSCVGEHDDSYAYDPQVFDDYVRPPQEELDRQIEEIWRGWVPPCRPDSSCLIRAPARPRVEDNVRLVDAPRPQHKFVPKWVFLARAKQRPVFLHALRFYFRHFRWPLFTELAPDFMRLCFARGVTPDKFTRTAGFAPVWVFLLKELVEKRRVDAAWFDRCVPPFFDTGRFPPLAEMPQELRDKCAEGGITDTHFFEVFDA